MTKQEAENINQGNEVWYNGEIRKVASVKVRGIAAPYFRLHNVPDGEVSYLLCRKVTTISPKVAD